MLIYRPIEVTRILCGVIKVSIVAWLINAVSSRAIHIFLISDTRNVAIGVLFIVLVDPLEWFKIVVSLYYDHYI